VETFVEFSPARMRAFIADIRVVLSTWLIPERLYE